MIEAAENFAPYLLRTTRVLWKGAGLFEPPRSGGEESFYAAWLRLFKTHMPLPVFAAPCSLEGSDVVLQVMPEGRVFILDPLRGHEIREITPDLRLQVERVANELGACHA